jgi:tight adherence protein C
MDVLQTLIARADADLMLPALLMLAAILVATTAVWSTVSERFRIKRRAAAPGATVDTAALPDETRRAGAAERRRAAKLLANVAQNFVPDDEAQVAQLKRRLLQAGFLKPSAIAGFFVARGLGAIVGGVGAAIGLDLYGIQSTQHYWLGVGAALIVGYMLPSFWLDHRIKGRAVEHRYGFPDFMDLMVVCADSGLAMEAALERVGREMATTHPSLSANLAMATLEMRAGRRLGEALEHLADRLSIEEARAFATLLQQSEELGSSMTEALRVYSDDMRHQRLMRAEEKAYALPAKLVIPLGIFIFPIVMVVALMPVVIRVKYGMMGG